LVFIICGIPGFALFYIGPTYGGLLSKLLNVLLVIYFLMNKKSKPAIVIIIFGFIYYSISGFFFTGDMDIWYTEAIKYFIFIICSLELAIKTNSKQIQIILLVGAISILIHTLFFPNSFGRYSGFYLNPNSAAVVCLIGFAYSYCIKSITYRLLAQFMYTVAGIMTLSRSFVLVLLLVILVSVLSNRKNIVGLLTGAVAIIIILGTTNLHLNTKRFNALKSIVSDDIDKEAITENPRNETWALYKDFILDKPFFGHGFKSMQGRETDTLGIKTGVHNTYLMVLGEAGIIPFFLLLYIYIYIFARSIRHFSSNPEYNYLAIILITYLLVSHNYFDNYIILFVSIWLYQKVKEDPEMTNPITQT